jgi:hypothetical protein
VESFYWCELAGEKNKSKCNYRHTPFDQDHNLGFPLGIRCWNVVPMHIHEKQGILVQAVPRHMGRSGEKGLGFQ